MRGGEALEVYERVIWTVLRRRVSVPRWTCFGLLLLLLLFGGHKVSGVHVNIVDWKATHTMDTVRHHGHV